MDIHALQISVHGNNTIRRWSESGSKAVPAKAFREASLVSVLFVDKLAGLGNFFESPWLVEIGGFKMRYSFHPHSQSPAQLENGLMNCSVDYYHTFQEHLDCNLMTECMNGQDETGNNGWQAGPSNRVLTKFRAVNTLTRSCRLLQLKQQCLIV